jgi:hypothetical protein
MSDLGDYSINGVSFFHVLCCEEVKNYILEHSNATEYHNPLLKLFKPRYLFCWWQIIMNNRVSFKSDKDSINSYVSSCSNSILIDPESTIADNYEDHRCSDEVYRVGVWVAIQVIGNHQG